MEKLITKNMYSTADASNARGGYLKVFLYYLDKQNKSLINEN